MATLPKTAKAARIAPSGCFAAMLLRGFVDPRAVALAPGADDLNAGLPNGSLMRRAAIGFTR